MDEVTFSGSAESEGMEGSEMSARPEVGATEPPPESSAFTCCMGCANAEAIDQSAGTLVCGKYNMRINAEADEIPDDCAGFAAGVAEGADA